MALIIWSLLETFQINSDPRVIDSSDKVGEIYYSILVYKYKCIKQNMLNCKKKV